MEKRAYLLPAFLLAALLLRLWLAPMRGHVHDIEQLKAWTETAVTQNPLGIYTYSTANYPPLGLLPLALMGHLYRLFFSADFDTSTAAFTALLKLPAIIADLLTAFVLYRYLAKHYSLRWAVVGFAAYAFNPAVIYNTAWWGQLESLVTLPMLLSVIALGDGRIRSSWFFLALAILTKPQAAVITPVIFIGSIYNRRKLLEGIGTAVGATISILLPFILAGQLPALIAQIRASAGRQLFLTMNAHNFWYLVTFGRGSFAARETANPILDTQPLLGPLTGWHIGLLLFLAFTLFITYKQFKIQTSLSTIHYASPLLFHSAAALIIGFYMLPAESHERYLFPALALLVPLLPEGRPYQLIYFLFTTTFLLNLLWVDSALPFPGFNQAFTQNLVLAVPLAALNTIFLIYHTIRKPQNSPKPPLLKPE